MQKFVLIEMKTKKKRKQQAEDAFESKRRSVLGEQQRQEKLCSSTKIACCDGGCNEKPDIKGSVVLPDHQDGLKVIGFVCCVETEPHGKAPTVLQPSEGTGGRYYTVLCDKALLPTEILSQWDQKSEKKWKSWEAVECKCQGGKGRCTS